MTEPELSEAQIADLAGGYRPTVDDAERCLKNAARHLADAARCSPEARLALTELAIEEAAKGILIHWRMDIQSSLDSPDGPVQAFRALRPEVRDLVSEFHSVLGDKALRDAFKDHRVKLAHLRFLAEVFGRELRGGNFVAWRPERPYSEETVRILAEFGEIPEIAVKGRAELVRRVDALAHLLNPDDPEDSLDKLRLRATYVDWSGKSTAMPAADPADSVKLSEVAAFLVNALAMSNVIHRDKHPPKATP